MNRNQQDTNHFREPLFWKASIYVQQRWNLLENLKDINFSGQFLTGEVDSDEINFSAGVHTADNIRQAPVGGRFDYPNICRGSSILYNMLKRRAFASFPEDSESTSTSLNLRSLNLPLTISGIMERMETLGEENHGSLRKPQPVSLPFFPTGQQGCQGSGSRPVGRRRRSRRKRNASIFPSAGRQ